MRVGLVGLGKMGAAMGARLLEQGHTLTVWNRTAAKATPLKEAGAAVAATPRALAAESDIIVSILFDAPAIEAAFRGPDGILSADLTGKIVVEMSTVRPEIEQKLATEVAARGAGFVECPVGGTVGPARTGKLLGLVGGSAEDLARVRPLLDDMCRRVEHIGPVGAGAAMKLAVNLPLAVFWQAFGESYALVSHLGLDPAWLVELFTDTSGAANGLKNRAAPVAAALAGGNGGPVTFGIDGIRKDLRTMIEEAASRGMSLPVAAGALSVYDEMERNGLGDRDSAFVPAYRASTVKP